MATGLIWKGTWVGPPSSFTYYINECVTYENISYVCVAPAGFVPPGSSGPNLDTTNWNIVVTGGQNGSPGPTGPTGSGGGGSGVTGATGSPGEAGATGESGATGSQGVTGSTGSAGATGAGLFTLLVGTGTPTILTPNSVSITAASQYVTQVESYNYLQSGIYFQAKISSGAPSFAPGTEYVSLGTTNYSGIIVGGNQIDLYGPAGYLVRAALAVGGIFSIYITPSTAYYYINGSLVTSTSAQGSPTAQSIAIAGSVGYPGPTETVISNISIYSTGKDG